MCGSKGKERKVKQVPFGHVAGEATEPGLEPRLNSEHRPCSHMHEAGIHETHMHSNTQHKHIHIHTHIPYCSLLWSHMLYSLPHAQLTP